jgi:hypothetical protein
MTDAMFIFGIADKSTALDRQIDDVLEMLEWPHSEVLITRWSSLLNSKVSVSIPSKNTAEGARGAANV